MRKDVYVDFYGQFFIELTIIFLYKILCLLVEKGDWA